MSVTIKDVAKLAGVSITTVSHVINETRFVAEDTKQKVYRAIKELGYVTNSNARGLRSNVSHRIGLLVPEVSEYFPVDIIEPIENVLLKEGYQLILGYTHDRIDLERRQIENFNYQQIDGLLMFPAIGDHSYMKEICDYPVVFLDRKAKNYEADCVLADDEDAVYRGISMLIEAGHKSVGIITGNQEISTSQVRYRGYEKALKEHNLTIDPSLVKMGNSKYSGGYEKTQELLDDGKMTALFPANIMMTISALKCLSYNNIRIPDDVAVLGFGDCPWAELTNPPLSTMRHPILELGKKAAEILLGRIKENTGEFRDYLIPVEIIKRKTF